jgi:phosphate transport system protein
MRTAFYEELSALSAQVGDMCGLAADAMEHATQALLGADLSIAEQVIADHEHIAAMSRRAEGSALKLLALQQPGAGARRASGGSSHGGRAGRARRPHRAAAASRMRVARRGSRVLR